ncbi:AraC-like DNA-binding protein [Saccharomonospora amisosensis]|uniref:AraC-like DNA-binding protein n=1 Tax=Saccharomonospora amisosensis TaxID=1128677 RepID=A0A7X5UP60_9PSEU|nr:AraC family transcriptional regulator [Saccharomonospora amisosensis]NIJ11362.1 AraC-like DNA-binding protein [Saccharomonospora amisosensis]
MGAHDRVATGTVIAWRPSVRGVREVFHASFPRHTYPPHTHDAWTLLVVDAGVVAYDLHRREHGACRPVVTLLPPDVAHDGRSARRGGFRKRVLYLERDVFGEDSDRLIGAAVDRPVLADPLLRHRVHQVHQALATRTEDLEAESRLALVIERLRGHLRQADTASPPRPNPGGNAMANTRTSTGANTGRDPRLAVRLRELLEAHVTQGITLYEAAARLHASRAHLVRAFGREYGIPPHGYLTGRRVDLARRHLLAGHSPAEAATLSGFCDQPHLTRHFTRLISVPPGHYARSRVCYEPAGAST